MKTKKYFYTMMSISIFLLIAFVATNYIVDLYGLFHDTKGRKIEAYADERVSKYLFSFNYIPTNFEGILIGPSLSDNLNTQKIESYKIYNASMMGANISDLKPLVLNTINNGDIKILVVCLDPYITKDFGKKSSVIDKKQYYSALGSVTLLKTYLIKFIREQQILPSKFKEVYINPYGYNDFDEEFAVEDPEKKIMKMVTLKKQEEMHVNKNAFKELEYVLDYARSKNIQIVGYFSPIPYQILKINDKNYYEYQSKIKSLFHRDDILINLNDEKYKNITSDFTTFIDHGHLSKKGQDFVLRELELVLSKINKSK